jgi:NAD(P)-dependent dehydrogenase (short-subunit alcohol dehydrogenase family)
VKKVFHGKKAVVVGGSGGIGRAIAASLLDEGADVCVIGRHHVPDTESLALELDYPENRIIVIGAAREADILCVVRGPFLQKPLHETTVEDWDRMATSNLAFPGSLVSAALPHMCGNEWGRILLFGGTRTDAVRGFRTNAAYAAAKIGLASLAKSVALEYASKGVSCNVICPGFVDTEYIEPGVKKALAGKNPDEKLISVDEIAELALFLMKNALYNGVIVTADKGWSPALV